MPEFDAILFDFDGVLVDTEPVHWACWAEVLKPQGVIVVIAQNSQRLGLTRELEDCRLWACAAAVDLTRADPAAVEERLDGVMSTPRFLREVAGAELVVV